MNLCAQGMKAGDARFFCGGLFLRRLVKKSSIPCFSENALLLNCISIAKCSCERMYITSTNEIPSAINKISDCSSPSIVIDIKII
jgi:hypothetical protein